MTQDPGWWGRFGGRYVAEALWEPLEKLSQCFTEALTDPEFLEQVQRWITQRAARPTPLTHLDQLSAQLGGAQLWLKREDLCAGGSFCLTLAIYQALIAKRLRRSILVAETATGDFGLAITSIARAMGMRARIYIGREDALHEPLRCAEIRALGAELEIVDASHRGRQAGRAEAQRFLLTHPEEAFYCSSLLCSPDPYPRIIAHALSLVGAEARAQMLRKAGAPPDFFIAPVGSGGLAAGAFLEFLESEPDTTRCIGVQAAGETHANRQSSSLLSGKEGVFQGTRSMVLRDQQGQLLLPYSAAAGLCVAGVGPQHAYWASTQQALYVSINDEEAERAASLLRQEEGILASLEAAHALSYGFRLAASLPSEKHVLILVSGAGDRDLHRFVEEAR